MATQGSISGSTISLNTSLPNETPPTIASFLLISAVFFLFLLSSNILQLLWLYDPSISYSTVFFELTDTKLFLFVIILTFFFAVNIGSLCVSPSYTIHQSPRLNFWSNKLTRNEYQDWFHDKNLVIF